MWIADDPKFAKAEMIADHSMADFANPGELAYVLRPKNKSARYVRVTALRLWERTKDFVFALGELQVESGGTNVALKGKVTAKDSIEAGRWSKKYLVDNFDSRTALAGLSDPKAATLWHQRDEVQIALAFQEQRRQELTATLIDAGTALPWAK